MKNPSKHTLHTILPLLVLSLFAICAFTVLLFGAQNYKELTHRDDSSYTQRTAIGYISGKIRQTASKEKITVEAFGDGDCLCLPSTYENEEYITRLYCLDGNLCELFTPADIKLDACDGETILPLQDMAGSIDGGMLKITLIYSQGDSAPLRFYVGEEAAQ